MSASKQEQFQEDERIEIIDLGLPFSARASGMRWLSFTLFALQRSARRRHWRAGSWLAVALLSVTFVLFNNGPFVQVAALLLHPASSPASARPSLSLQEQGDMACLVDAAWSPDAHFIVVLGYRERCGQAIEVPALVSLYELHARPVLKHQFTPDAAILQALSRPSLPSQRGRVPQKEGFSTGIAYTHVLWSPDGQRLAITFSISSPDAPTRGVVLLNSDGADQAVWLSQQALSVPFSDEWQFSPPAANAPKYPSSIPVALAYHWGTGGALLFQSLLIEQTISATDAAGPVGNPDGGPSFSIWQPGVLSATQEVDPSQKTPRMTTNWKTAFAAWSPDGRYLVGGMNLSARLKPQESVDADCLSRQALLLLDPDMTISKEHSREVTLAWRPDGQVLAVYTPGKAIALYRCSDGLQLASFALSGQDAVASATAIALRWSGDGAHLFFCSAQGHLVILVGNRPGREDA